MITKFKLFEGSVKSEERIDIFRDEKYILVAPLTAKASMKYGAFTNWCTSVPDGSYMDAWSGNDPPNAYWSKRGLLILIRRNYKMTKKNSLQSEEYYLLNRGKDDDDLTKKQYQRWLKLQGDRDSYDMSKICITFSTVDSYAPQIWSANNQDMEMNIYELSSFGIDNYISDEIYNYIQRVKENRKRLMISSK